MIRVVKFAAAAGAHASYMCCGVVVSNLAVRKSDGPAHRGGKSQNALTVSPSRTRQLVSTPRRVFVNCGTTSRERSGGARAPAGWVVHANARWAKERSFAKLTWTEMELPDVDGKEQDSEQCAICIDALDGDTTATIACGHVFHTACRTRYLLILINFMRLI